MEEIDEVTIAKLDICREQIEKEYGKEISRAVGKVMGAMMLAVLKESVNRNLDHVTLLGATTKSITIINKLAETYSGVFTDSGNN